MRKILLLIIALSIPSFYVYADLTTKTYNYKITKIKDGDTIEIEAPFLPDPLPKVISIRVDNVDTPEKGGHAHCKYEADLGAKATAFTKKMYAESKSYTVVFHKWDKWGGRVIGDVFFDGKSLSSLLIENGLAREYHGEKKKSWCDIK